MIRETKTNSFFDHLCIVDTFCIILINFYDISKKKFGWEVGWGLLTMRWKFHFQFFMDFILFYSIMVSETGKPIVLLTIYLFIVDIILIHFYDISFFCELLTMSWNLILISSGIWMLMIGLLISSQPYLISLTPSNKHRNFRTIDNI